MKYLFTTKGLYCYIEEDTRCKRVGNRLDKTTLSQFFFKIVNV